MFHRTTTTLGLLCVGIVFSLGLASFVPNEALAGTDACGNSGPQTFLQVQALEGTCQAGGFLDGNGVADCKVAPNGNVTCKCTGNTIQPVTDLIKNCPPGGGGPTPTLCGAIIGNKTDQCCITGIGEQALLTPNTHSNATPAGVLKFQCHVKGNR